MNDVLLPLFAILLLSFLFLVSGTFSEEGERSQVSQLDVDLNGREYHILSGDVDGILDLLVTTEELKSRTRSVKLTASFSHEGLRYTVSTDSTDAFSDILIAFNGLSSKPAKLIGYVQRLGR